jgi:hypothetical protein
MAYTTTDLANVERAIIDLATNKRTVRVRIGTDEFQYSLVDLPQLRSLRNEIAAEVADSAESGITSFCFSGGKGL